MGRKGKNRNKGTTIAKLRAEQKQKKKRDKAQYKRETRRERKKRFGRKSGWQSDWNKFGAQVRAYNLILRDVAADGNCLFSSVSDQLEGSEGNHRYYRQECVKFMRDHEDEFKWFLDEDEDGEIGAYLDEMADDGTWGGNLEIVAMSRRFRINCIVHQLAAPRFAVNYEDGVPDKTIHLSYHQGEHYASVRRSDDDTRGAARAIVLVEPGAPPAKNSTADTSRKQSPAEVVEMATGCHNREHVQEVLTWNNGDVDAAVEFLLMERNDCGTEAWEHRASPEDRPQSQDHSQSAFSVPKTNRPRGKMTKRERKLAKHQEKAQKRKREQQKKRHKEAEPPDEIDPELAAKIGSIAI